MFKKEERFSKNTFQGFIIHYLLSTLSLVLCWIDRLLHFLNKYLRASKDIPYDLQNFGDKKYLQKSVLVEIKDKKDKKDKKEKNKEEGDDEEEEEESTNAYRNIFYGDKGKNLTKSSFPNVFTMDKFYETLSEKYGNKNCWGSRNIIKYVSKLDQENNKQKVPEFSPIKWFTFSECLERMKNISLGISLLTDLNSFGRLALYEDTCIEWILICHSCWRYNITVSTVYSTLGIENVFSALNESEVTCLFTNESKLEILKQKITQKCPKIKSIIYRKSCNHDEKKIKQFEQQTNIKLYSFEDVEKTGKYHNSDKNKNSILEKNKIKNKPKKDDLALIMYTSGTTGKPKGVMLAHETIIGAIVGLSSSNIKEKYVCMGYLPYAHIFAIAAEHYIIGKGGCVGFGSPKTLFDKGCSKIGDLNVVKPTFMVAVPRIFEILKKNIISKVSDENQTPFIKRWLINQAYKYKDEALKKGYTTPLWDTLVFQKFRDLLGGRVKILISGGGPLNPSTHRFIRICFCCSVVQGYGLTESGAALSCQGIDHPFQTGNCGSLAPSLELKLVSCKEMNYTIHDKYPRGEIVIRGSNIAKGYYKKTIETKKAFKPFGWFKTGDIGQINYDGTLSVIDRKKNLIKLQSGEYISLEKLESIYGTSKFCSANGICITANNNENFIVANVIPDQVRVKRWFSQQKYFKGKQFNFDEVCKSVQLRQEILEDMLDKGRKNNLSRIEMLKDIRVHSGEWTATNGFLTAAMKLKRRVINQNYKNDIDEMYKLNKTFYKNVL